VTERSGTRHAACGAAAASHDDAPPPPMTEGQGAAPGPPDPLDLAGRLLERKYRVDRVVAEGGFGVVYAGHHLGLDRPIAIKVLRHAHRGDPDAWSDALAQFLLEARTLARLRNPRVVTVYDAGVLVNDANPAGVPWHVLEWIEGETLAEDLARRRGQGGRAPGECMALLRGVMEAIADAHQNGIAHRDLKPSNIMLEQTRGLVVPRVLDFGIAKIMAGDEVAATGRTATAAQHEAFSPAYAAPEQVSRMRTGPWTDVHALGLLLTELLTDREPYPRGDPNDLYRAVFDETRPTPAMHGVDVGAWEPVIGRALAIKPHERHATAGALLAALESALDVNAAAPPSGAAMRPRAAGVRSSRRGWAVAAMLAATACIAAGVRWSTAPASRPSAAPPACSSNAECIAAGDGKAAICRRDQGRCVALDSVDCTAHFEPAALEAADTVWLGTLFPTTGPLAASGAVNTRAVELARRDFAQITGGMSGQRASTRAPSFGLITCDDAVDAVRAAKHLVDVGVPAVIGFQSGVETIELATSLFIPNQVLAISAISTNPLVTRIPHPPGTPRLVFRTTYNSLETARAMTALVHGAIEPGLRAPGKGGVGGAGLRPAPPLRVALLRQKNAAGAGFSKEIFDTLRVNGKSAFENGRNFREFTYGSEDTSLDELGLLAAELGEFLPQVILYFGGSGVIQRIFVPLEASWSDAQVPRPRYVSVSHFTPEMLEFIGTDQDRRARVFGTMLVSSTPENERFVMHYNETYAERTTLTDSPNTAYDAFYLLAFAAYASTPPINGAALSRATTRLGGPGRSIEVGMTSIFDAFVALRNGENVDLTGSSGTLDLDPETGEVKLDLAILCASIDDRGRAIEGIESGLYYRTEKRELQGALRCP